jgi:CDP-diacylglycerol--serine O-phosphatidyltransferase
MKRHIPNGITLLNLIFGCCAVGAIFYGDFITAFWCLLAAALADFADGFVARLLGVSSPLGKELDSLADMVSFGFAPGAIYYHLLLIAFGLEASVSIHYIGLPAFVLTAFSCLRLAKFNLDTRQAESFIGLPTPASTLFTVGVLLIYHYDSFGLGHLMVNPIFLFTCIVLLSYLLVAEVPMFSLKFKSSGWKGNEIRFIFAGITVILFILAKEAAFALVILLYIVFSIISHLKTSG